jgi:WD40 repeat protein
MAGTPLTAVLRQVRKLAALPPDGRPTDAELLERFTRARDAAAFEALVARHGPLVWRVCRRVLGHDHDAEDAWQATFLVLARGAGAVRNPGALAERYKAPVLLCYWQGRTNEEAARQLGWATGTLKARLAKARQLLHARLTARGVTLPAGAVALLLSPAGEAAEAVPPSLAAATASAGHAGAEASGVSAGAAALAWEALKRAGPSRLKLVMAFLLVLGAAGLGAGSLSQTPRDEPPAREHQAAGDAGRPKGPGVKQPEPRRDLYGDPLPPGAVARLGTVRLRHGDIIRAVAFAPDGKSAATCDSDGFAYIWDLATGKEMRRFRPGLSGVSALAHTAAGRVLALAVSKDGLQLWDVNTGQSAGELIRVGEQCRCVGLSGDGKLAVTAKFGDRDVQLWDTDTGKELRRIPTGHTKRVEDVQLSPDGRLLASTGWPEMSVRLHATRTGALLHHFTGEATPAGGLAFAPDGEWVAGVQRERSILLWNVATGKVVRRFQQPRERIVSVAFTADGKTLISGGDQVRFWDVATGKSIRQLTPPPRSGSHIALAPDGRMLATWGECELVLWDLKAGRQRRLAVGHQGPVHRVAVSPNGRLAATACFGDVARLWDLATGRELRQFPGLGDEGTAGVAFSADGRLLAIPDAVATVRLWNTDTGAEVRRLAVERPMDVAFSADGKVLVTASQGSVVHLWDPATGKKLRQLNLSAFRTGPGGGDFSVALSPDGQLLAAAGSAVVIWRLDSGKLWRRLTEPARDGGGPVAFSPDGRLVAARGLSKHNNTIRLWEAASGKEVATLCDKSTNCFTSIAFSPDGRTIAAGSLGFPRGGDVGKLVLWDLASGKELAARADHRGWLIDVTFTPDGRRLITGAYDTTALVWDVPALMRGTRPEALRVAPAELDGLWADLAGADAARAWQAVWKLAADPAQALPLLRRHLRPAPAPDADRVAWLLADLGSERFDKRDRAARELEAVGEAAAPVLRRALEARPPLETRRRIEAILEQWEGPTAARLVAVRATAVLERAGTAEARRLLDELAGGAPGAHLTQAARASVQRLGKRGPSAP